MNVAAQKKHRHQCLRCGRPWSHELDGEAHVHGCKQCGLSVKCTPKPAAVPVTAGLLSGARGRKNASSASSRTASSRFAGKVGGPVDDFVDVIRDGERTIEHGVIVKRLLSPLTDFVDMFGRLEFGIKLVVIGATAYYVRGRVARRRTRS